MREKILALETKKSINLQELFKKRPLNSIEPTANLDRIPSLDFLRGLAILGILFINVENFAYPDSWSPWKYGFESDVDRDTRFWVYFLTQGKFYTLFALLFGVSFTIFLERLAKKKQGLLAMDLYARRLLWLFVIGVVHAYFIWEGDVLYHYAICGFLLFPFRSMNSRSLCLVAGILSLVLLSNTYRLTSKRIDSYQMFCETQSIPKEKWTPEQEKQHSYWTAKSQIQSPDTAYYAAPKPTYVRGLIDSYERSTLHKGTIYHTGLLFRSLLIMIIGMLLYRSGIFQDYTHWKRYWLISFSVLILGLVVNFLRYHQWTYEYNVPILHYGRATLFTFPKEILGLGYLLVFNGLFQRYLTRLRIKMISTIGKMALSNYILQNVLAGFIFYGYGLNKFNSFTRFELLGVVAIIWAIQILLNLVWSRTFSRGPLESLWRKLTYFESITPQTNQAQ